VPTHSNDPLLSREERLELTDLMELCTNLSQRVLDWENTKTSQAVEITKLKEMVKKLERRNKSRTPELKRLRKVGRSAQVVSSEDEGLGAQEDASKQGRKIAHLDADAEEVEVEKVVSTAEVTIASATTTTVDELTLAQTLIEIKAAKPKAVTTATTKTTTAVTRPKARGVVVQDPNQILIDEEIAQRLQEELQAEIEEEERLAQEQEELTIEERSKMFVELVDKRKKHFARLRAEEQRRKPPTKARKRSQMSTYLKHMAEYKQNQLKNKNYDEIQKLFDKAMTSMHTKRAGNELEQEKAKKQKIDDDEAEMKNHMEIVPDDEVAIDAIPLATKPPIISIDREDLETLWKLVKAKHENTMPEEGYEIVLWGDLKVMFEPDVESNVWRNLQGHKVTVWKLFSSSGVHFVRF
ncbi:hypothetical protein Tco_0442231, partial [Tanacetum coccineum]